MKNVAIYVSIGILIASITAIALLVEPKVHVCFEDGSCVWTWNATEFKRAYYQEN